jgi:hypothetical protein
MAQYIYDEDTGTWQQVGLDKYAIETGNNEQGQEGGTGAPVQGQDFNSTSIDVNNRTDVFGIAVDTNTNPGAATTDYNQASTTGNPTAQDIINHVQEAAAAAQDLQAQALALLHGANEFELQNGVVGEIKTGYDRDGNPIYTNLTGHDVLTGVNAAVNLTQNVVNQIRDGNTGLIDQLTNDITNGFDVGLNLDTLNATGVWDPTSVFGAEEGTYFGGYHTNSTDRAHAQGAGPVSDGPSPEPSPTPQTPAPDPNLPPLPPGITQDDINKILAWQGGSYSQFGNKVADVWASQGITDPATKSALIQNAIDIALKSQRLQASGAANSTTVVVNGVTFTLTNQTDPWNNPNWKAFADSNQQAYTIANKMSTDPKFAAAYAASNGWDAATAASWQQRILDPVGWAKSAAAASAAAGFVAGGGNPGSGNNSGSSPAPVSSSTVTGKNTVTTTTTTTNAQTQALAAAQQSVQATLAAQIRTNPSNYVRRRSGLPTVSAAIEAANANTVAKLNNTSTNIADAQANAGIPTVVQTTATTDTASGQTTTTSVAAATNKPVSYVTDPSLTTAVDLAIGTYTAPLANASSTVAGNATTLGLNTAAVVSNVATSTGNAVNAAAIPTTPVTTIATTPVAAQSSTASDPLASVATFAALATAAAPALSKLLTPANSTTVPVSATIGTNNVQNEYVAAVDATSTSTTNNWGIFNTTTGSFVIKGLTQDEAEAGAAADNAAQPGNSASQASVAAANADADQIFKNLATKQEGLQAQTSFVNNGDWRVKLSLAPGAQYLYNDQNNAGILQPLQNTGGVIFPYTPQIDTNYRAEYDNYALTHSNYKSYAYKSSYVDNINLTASFTAQDTQEATYLLAVIQFFKSVTKMFYGANDPNRGVPPPLVFLTGLGEFQFNAHPCVVTNFAYSLPKDVDYIRARSTTINGTDLLTTRDRKTVATDIISSTITRLSNLFTSQGITKGAEFGWRPAPQTLGGASPTYVPTKMDITLTLLPIQSRSQVSQEFNLQNYANGNLLKGGFW